MDLTLILFRHAEAVDATAQITDHARTLTPRGEEQARSTAAQLAAVGYQPSLALVSDAQRTRGTWQQAEEQFAKRPEVLFSRDIYLSGVEGLSALISKQEDRHSTVILVGHNPHISGLGSDLAGQDLRFHKADAVVFRLKASGWYEAAYALGDWELSARFKAKV